MLQPHERLEKVEEQLDKVRKSARGRERLEEHYAQSGKTCLELRGIMQNTLEDTVEDEVSVKHICGIVKPRDALKIGFFCMYQSGYCEFNRRSYITCSYKRASGAK